jgi:predicted mannosyl-3-phosphoglycerate phosphatase (HAD superfamily)
MNVGVPQPFPHFDCILRSRSSSARRPAQPATSRLVGAQIPWRPDSLPPAITAIVVKHVMRRPRSVVVFSNVDAVLRHPRDSAFAFAADMLRQLLEDEGALVLCSSKTRAELEFVQQMLGLTDPFICEHGAATFVPDDYFDVEIPRARQLPGYRAVEFGSPYSQVIEALRRTAERLRIEIVGFNDMSIEQVAWECRLPLLHARLAKLREYEEKFRIVRPDPAVSGRLAKALHGSKLRLVEGDPFDYVGAPVDLWAGVHMLRGLYRRAYHSVLTIGVTETRAGGDEPLPALVDHHIIIRDLDVAPESVTVMDWARAIVGGVHAVRRSPERHTASGRPGVSKK